MSNLILRKFPSSSVTHKATVKTELLKQRASALQVVAEKGVIYQVVEQETGKPPCNLVLRRKSKALLVIVDG